MSTDPLAIIWIKSPDGTPKYPTLSDECVKNFSWGPCPGAGQPVSSTGDCPVCRRPTWKPMKNGKVRRHSGRLPDHTEDCVCQGQRRVPVAEEVMVARLWEILLAPTDRVLVVNRKGKDYRILDFYNPIPVGVGPTLLAALLAALEA